MKSFSIINSVLLILLLSLAGASAENDLLLEKYFNIAVDSYNNSDIRAAKNQFEAILSIYPDHQPSRGYIEKCDVLLKKLAISSNLKIDRLLNKSRISFNKQHYFKAKKYYLQILQIDPDNMEAKNGLNRVETITIELNKQGSKKQNRGRIDKMWKNALKHDKAGDKDAAKTICINILAIAPDYYPAKEYLSQSDSSLKNIAATHVNELYTQALEFYIEGNYTEAMKYFETTAVAAQRYFEAVIWNQPQRLDILEFIDDCRQKLKEENERIENMELEKIKSRVMDIYNRANKYFERKYYKAAMAELMQGKSIAAKYNFNDYSDKINTLIKDAGSVLSMEYYEKGMAAFTENNLTEAGNLFKKALEYQPDNQNAIRALERIK